MWFLQRNVSIQHWSIFPSEYKYFICWTQSSSSIWSKIHCQWPGGLNFSHHSQDVWTSMGFQQEKKNIFDCWTTLPLVSIYICGTWTVWFHIMQNTLIQLGQYIPSNEHWRLELHESGRTDSRSFPTGHHWPRMLEKWQISLSVAFGFHVFACKHACVPVCFPLFAEYTLHANSSQCEQMLVSNALGFCTTVRHFVGSSALRRSPWRCLNCFIERNKTRDTQARSGCQEHTQI